MNSKKDNAKRETVIRTILHYLGSLLGTPVFLLCAYWFFHFETWTERGVYIGLTLLAVYILIKLVPKKYH
ncbi:hypothetical protein COO59_16940 [Mixta theicola]|uniref:Uncharacterized protein n=1 Tax=Mixta theicola TaxID=1458355 RepID=A0A2K1Q615_9GAMM|nr:hypothetical protein [Mixta theicola]PNS10448.1 hypothetical protein COO59_16940 [Mixta theicola]GLR08304.1 hypothetical protein GCM10007905_10230 [Mixta theicola]